MSISPAATKRANMPRSTPSNPVAPRRSPKEDGGRSSVRSGDNASGLSVCDVDGDRTGANRPVAAAVGATALCPRERVDSDGTNCSVGCGITLRSLWLSFLTFLGRPFVRCSFVKSCARKVVRNQQTRSLCCDECSLQSSSSPSSASTFQPALRTSPAQALRSSLAHKGSGKVCSERRYAMQGQNHLVWSAPWSVHPENVMNFCSRRCL